jgi:hypothetical protein
MASQNIVLTQMTLGTIFSGVMAYLKSAKWAPWFSQHSAKINHAFLLITSAAGAIGVHWVWDATAHSLTITGLSLITVGAGIWEWAKQWTVQYLIQRGAFGPVAIPGDAPAPAVTPVAVIPGAKP